MQTSGSSGSRPDVIDLNRFLGVDALRAADKLRDEGLNVTTVTESLPPIAGVLAALAPMPAVEPGDHVVVHTWGNEVVRMSVDAAAREHDRDVDLNRRVVALESLADRVDELERRERPGGAERLASIERRIGDLEERAVSPDRLDSIEQRIGELEERMAPLAELLDRVAALEAAAATRETGSAQPAKRSRSTRGTSSGSKSGSTSKREEA
ncbi:hypothetical protein [Mycolicibacterium sp. CR10]|uniref:hypothetical protein n=1 Tax=Mycolicibacterium sp. CR10 TaxID=2562314 RepID=UPI0010C011A6|nr:hypothetical protein [Mycolicibacterium sp. CR10]